MRRLGLAGVLTIAAATWTQAASVGGSGITISQTTISFSAGNDSQALTASNPGMEAIRIQARLFKWQNNGSEDIYSPTQDIGFSPAIFALQPGARQVVRLVALVPHGSRELAYRLFIDELPPPARGNSVVLPVRLVIPVFLQSSRRIEIPELAWQANEHSGSVTLTAFNSGSAHARVTDLEYGGDGGRHAIASGLAGYVLAGEKHSWSFPFRGSSLDISARTEQGDIHQSVPLTAQ